VDVDIAWDAAPDADGAYLAAVRAAFPPRGRAFRPDLLVWYFGFDGHRGDYGDLGLTAACFLGLADLMVAAADELAGGRLVVVLGGGSRTDLATLLIPPIIGRLAGADPAVPL
jgi:acetoin utilization deacetylase AcuC-like enzyme